MRSAILSVILALPLAGQVPTGKPEDAGMSSERLKRIHEGVQKHIDANEITGAVTLVARHGKIVHFEAHGLMDTEEKKPMTKDAIFRLASMTKPVTGVAVMMMLEEGKLHLNDPVSKFIPEFKNMKVAMPNPFAPAQAGGGRGQAQGQGQPAGPPDFFLQPAAREITVVDLLTHTSGVMSGGLGAREGNRTTPKLPTDTLATYVPKLANVPLDFQPGTKWAYSGSAGPEVLGRIVEIVSGMSYDQFLKTRIFDPLGMKDTAFFPADDKRARLVTLYDRYTLKKSPNQDGMSSKIYFGAGSGLTSTAQDYLQFAQMLLNGGKLNGKILLSPRTVELMHSNHVGEMHNGQLGRPAHGMGYGLLVGIVEDPVAAGLRVGKGSWGWDGAYGTQTWIDPTNDMVTIVMMQEQTIPVQRDFENAVMQAIIE